MELSRHPYAFISLSLEAGGSLRDVQDAAGHADPRTTRRYDRASNNLDEYPTDRRIQPPAGAVLPDCPVPPAAGDALASGARGEGVWRDRTGRSW